ncbi:MAG: dihydroneopterin aldolase [Firmicutes bacterium]|jgi:dihydroneopterin aldolase|nr:dihydroneopterin aldolase [Bacillota bacterium]
MPSDRLTLKNLIFYAYHGAFAAEKELGQRFEVDVDMRGDFQACSNTDDLDLAINYVDVYTLVREIVEEREFNLIETAARTVADEIASAYPVKEVTVRVRKPHAPIGGPMDYVEVEVTRRGASGTQPGQEIEHAGEA